MSNAENLASCMDAILAIPTDQVLEPNIPVDVFVQEAENLVHWSKDDLPLLKNAGINAQKINDLNARAGACREAQSLWVKDRRSVKDAQRQWNEESPAAYDLRDELLHTYRYAFRTDEKLLGRVAEIADGAGNADMVQDLNDLAVLGRENLPLLNAINFDATRLDTATTLSSEMGDLLAASNGDKASNNDSKVLRDRAYTYLKELMDEVRACGKYLFWKKPNRLKGYQSDFWRKRNSKKSSASDVPEEA
jgi:hypothetical protein